MPPVAAFISTDAAVEEGPTPFDPVRLWINVPGSPVAFPVGNPPLWRPVEVRAGPAIIPSADGLVPTPTPLTPLSLAAVPTASAPEPERRPGAIDKPASVPNPGLAAPTDCDLATFTPDGELSATPEPVGPVDDSSSPAAIVPPGTFAVVVRWPDRELADSENVGEETSPVDETSTLSAATPVVAAWAAETVVERAITATPPSAGAPPETSSARADRDGTCALTVGSTDADATSACMFDSAADAGLAEAWRLMSVLRSFRFD
jgi:hypothetical protein